MRRRLLIFGLAALLAGPAIGQPAGLRPSVEAARLAPEPDLAYGAYQRGLYLTAVREATSRLDRDPDDAAAMTLLAEIPDAQHALGVLYLRGRGVARDTSEAARWFLRAAENGNTAGEVEYAILLFNGDGVARDERLAARYFRRAAGRGNTIAQNRLARLYAVGRGVAKNLTEAAAWHLLASGRGLTDTWLDETLKGLSAEERAAAEKLAAQRADLI